ncbi:hypothetical protein Pyrde_0586 [Pyrodictium delaneyi]|uniref:Uncharacterized protein n=1 Tax=Pyrodictium delaneyi TaxID=1273541 RepID=A0A0P0N207_9CREN|nr:hypothetical protein [Pyrodictium delaneyi]ALL00636.1 hypothetical protein Pyrde_0586 [Pyrodictium delaneyi]
MDVEYIDPYKLLRTLEDVTDKHARAMKSLNRALVRLRRDLDDEELQTLVLNYIRKLRILRRRLARSLNGAVNLDSVAAEVRDNIATLSEYMIIVGAEYERDLLNKALILAKRGARLLEESREAIEDDLRQIDELVEKLQDIVDRYY